MARGVLLREAEGDLKLCRPTNLILQGVLETGRLHLVHSWRTRHAAPESGVRLGLLHWFRRRWNGEMLIWPAGRQWREPIGHCAWLRPIHH